MSTEPLEILVVDDDAAMREVLELRLASRGFTVHLAENGAEAERLVGETRPDAVLSDVALPDFSGLELLKKELELSQEHAKQSQEELSFMEHRVDSLQKQLTEAGDKLEKQQVRSARRCLRVLWWSSETA